MTMLPVALLSASVFLASWWLTGQLHSYAVSRQLFDIPNARSSHAVATPRGGGLAIVMTTLLALPVVAALDALAWPGVWGLAGGGALVALIGFADDHRPVAPSWRLLGHFIGASWILFWMDGSPQFAVPGSMGWVGHILAILYLVWLLNLTNFMDGIDGIAGVEVITVCVGGALLYLAARPGAALWATPVVLASATLGFLMWNWPPAKIFMGDAGSGFLGLMLAALSLQAGWVARPLFWGWVILAGVFIVDATVTLLRRVVRRERVYEAHRSHAYQHAAVRSGTHVTVTVAVGAINLCWLLPIAGAVAFGLIDGPLGVLIAYVPLVGVALWLKAGTPVPSARAIVQPGS
jgi:Fuc2NAc and GlcNAc transferase